MTTKTSEVLVIVWKNFWESKKDYFLKEVINLRIDLTQTHDVIGAYQALDCSGVRQQYTDPGTKYAFEVLDEKVITGYLIKLAAFRHIRDLQRQGSVEFPFAYSVKRVDQVLKFASICPNVDTGEPTKLMPWQEFIMAMLIGWRNDDGGKRFSRAIVSVARGWMVKVRRTWWQLSLPIAI